VKTHLSTKEANVFKSLKTCLFAREYLFDPLGKE